jgi:ribonuclease E
MEGAMSEQHEQRRGEEDEVERAAIGLQAEPPRPAPADERRDDSALDKEDQEAEPEIEEVDDDDSDDDDDDTDDDEDDSDDDDEDADEEIQALAENLA